MLAPSVDAAILRDYTERNEKFGRIDRLFLFDYLGNLCRF